MATTNNTIELVKEVYANIGNAELAEAAQKAGVAKKFVEHSEETWKWFADNYEFEKIEKEQAGVKATFYAVLQKGTPVKVVVKQKHLASGQEKTTTFAASNYASLKKNIENA